MRHRVLVIEDEPEMQMILRDNLEVEEDTTPPATDYASLTKKFETHSKSLVGENVQVSSIKINNKFNFVTVAPP